MASDADGVSVLHEASNFRADADIIELLLDHGADVAARWPVVVDYRVSEYWGQATPLHWAATSNATPQVVSLLIERGADRAAINFDGKTPCQIAQVLGSSGRRDSSQALQDALRVALSQLPPCQRARGPTGAECEPRHAIRTMQPVPGHPILSKLDGRQHVRAYGRGDCRADERANRERHPPILSRSGNRLCGWFCPAVGKHVSMAMYSTLRRRFLGSCDGRGQRAFGWCRRKPH